MHKHHNCTIQKYRVTIDLNNQIDFNQPNYLLRGCKRTLKWFTMNHPLTHVIYYGTWFHGPLSHATHGSVFEWVYYRSENPWTICSTCHWSEGTKWPICFSHLLLQILNSYSLLSMKISYHGHPKFHQDLCRLSWLPKIIKTEDKSHQIQVSLDVFGFKPENLKVHLKGNELTMSNNQIQEISSDGSIIERSFTRKYTLPDIVDTEKSNLLSYCWWSNFKNSSATQATSYWGCTCCQGNTRQG